MNLLGVPVALLDVGVIHFVKMAAELDLGSDGLSKAEFRILVLHLISPTSTDMRENILELLGAVNVSASSTLPMYAPAAHKASPTNSPLLQRKELRSVGRLQYFGDTGRNDSKGYCLLPPVATPK